VILRTADELCALIYECRDLGTALTENSDDFLKEPLNFTLKLILLEERFYKTGIIENLCIFHLREVIFLV